ncbi:NADPH:quinone oxidoreductase family protein [Nonomuraea cavernae]|uniref:NADPH:quinone oxidoreductase n=1 Tax=Nonomuraea cavernae TaxID=2045107 RepID=A0A917Z2N7_9ACTN|nr:NADPH:quinone oxidoreductase family protein [Nonomuraea cavernae]MCA2187939.1 NADPH:quinone oxidoreductase family protein [Nonomuraea cavernae]GGO72307.1 NADPH:quinone oxidoreductase [Nonomuraea cavernae]
MRALICEKLGSVTVAETQAPEPAAGQIVIDVEAAGVNYVDALFVHGRYQIKLPPPFVPGSEVAGTVSAVAPDVTWPSVGTRVVAMCGLGGFAERVAVPAAGAVEIPGALDAARAATFTQSYCTALFALRDRGGLRAGETVLVLGAGGGVGLAAVRVATTLGATVLAGASSEDKRRAARDAGAVAVVDTTARSVKEAAREFSPGGVDLVYDPVGGDLADPALRSLRPGGRYLVIGFASGAIPSLPLNQVLLRNRAVIGVDWGAWSMSDRAGQHALLTELLGLVDDGALSPAAPATAPLESGARILDDLLERRVTGKVALIP